MEQCAGRGQHGLAQTKDQRDRGTSRTCFVLFAFKQPLSQIVHQIRRMEVSDDSARPIFVFLIYNRHISILFSFFLKAIRVLDSGLNFSELRSLRCVYTLSEQG